MPQADDNASHGAISDYRLGEVEREVAELRAKIESGQGAMLQAVAGVNAQLTQFRLDMGTDLGNRFVSQLQAADFVREMRERAEANARRLNGFDQVYIKELEAARVAAETKRTEDAERGLRINLALVTSIASIVGSTVLHFAKF